MGVNAQKQEEGFIMMSSPPSNLSVTSAPVGVPGEYTNRVVFDDERSDHGAPVGYQTRQLPQMVMVPNSQAQNKQITEDLPSSAASVSSDCLLAMGLFAMVLWKIRSCTRKEVFQTRAHSKDMEDIDEVLDIKALEDGFVVVTPVYLSPQPGSDTQREVEEWLTIVLKEGK